MTDMTGEGMTERRGVDDGFSDFEPDLPFDAAPGDPFGLNELHSGDGPVRGVSPFAALPSDADEPFWGLSDPAQPRNTRPPEVGPFAPEADQPVFEERTPARTLDDFDELLASELATLNVQPVMTEPAYVPHEAAAPVHEENAPFIAAHSPDRLPDVLRGKPRSRRLVAWGGGVAAVALLGLFGAYAGLGGVVGQGGEPILIRADTDPVRIAPENPGGRVIPNQDQAVYERVGRAGSSQGGPQQQMLITAAEQPLDIDLNEGDSNLPGVMVGVSDFPEMVQLAQAETPASEAAQQSPTLQPHRVRTFEVRPDGTLVPRTDAAEAPAVVAPLTPPAGQTEPLAPVAPTAPPAEEAAPVEAAPEPVAPPVAEEAAPPAPAPENAFYVQISSQPSEALARESMTTLSSRYASVIGQRPLAIQSAEIPDRGTFYRVRITTGSREEANQVCQSLQSAGGSCFVTR